MRQNPAGLRIPVIKTTYGLLRICFLEKDFLGVSTRNDSILCLRISKRQPVLIQVMLPEDAALVILNAYDVQFFDAVENVLKQNVATMRKIIDECNLDKVIGICIFSTEYV